MELFNRKPRIKNTGAPDFSVFEGDDLEVDEGGVGPFKGELSQYRFAHQQGSIDLAKSGYNPDAWDGGRFLFDLETALAHLYQELRDRLQIYSRNEIQDATEEMYSAAGEVAMAQAELQRYDRAFLRATELEDLAFSELRDEPQEIVRLNNLRSNITHMAKLGIAALFVVSEFVITGFIFNQALPLDINGIGYVLALGVILMLIVVPHYLAQGMKEGITEHHSFDLDDGIITNIKDLAKKKRQAHRENKDDKGFRVISMSLFIILLALVIPLSVLRASDTLTGNKYAWFFSFLFIQLCISGYFFLREWIDHGAPSVNLHRLENDSKRAQRVWESAFADYADAIDVCITEAQPVFKAMLDYQRMDAAIVESFYATIHYGRHLQEIERPELAVYINGARIPYLGSSAEISDERGMLYDAVSSSNRPLEIGDSRSRGWMSNQIEIAIGNSSEKSSYQDMSGSTVFRPASGGMIDSSAREWLYGYLKEHFGISQYVIPEFVNAKQKFSND